MHKADYFCHVRLIFSIVLTGLVLFVATKDLVSYIGFYANQNFISETLCENRNFPEKKCHGKCFLKKTIKKNHDNENGKPNPIKEKKITLQLFISNSFIENDRFKEDEYVPLKGENSEIITNPFLQEIFHPPEFL